MKNYREASAQAAQYWTGADVARKEATGWGDGWLVSVRGSEGVAGSCVVGFMADSGQVYEYSGASWGWQLATPCAGGEA